MSTPFPEVIAIAIAMLDNKKNGNQIVETKSHAYCNTHMHVAVHTYISMEYIGHEK